MRIKSGVILAGLHPSMRTALIEADLIMKEHGFSLVITSGLEGTHSAGSLHYYGFAFDARTRHLEGKEKEIHKEISDALPGFDVVLERTHIHIENEIAFRRVLCNSET